MISLLLLVAASQSLASWEAAREPTAIGPSASIDQAARQARACGITSLRVDPLDDEKALLLLGPNRPAAISCIRTWIKANGLTLKLEHRGEAD